MSEVRRGYFFVVASKEVMSSYARMAAFVYWAGMRCLLTCALAFSVCTSTQRCPVVSSETCTFFSNIKRIQRRLEKSSAG